MSLVIWSLLRSMLDDRLSIPKTFYCWAAETKASKKCYKITRRWSEARTE